MSTMQLQPLRCSALRNVEPSCSSARQCGAPQPRSAVETDNDLLLRLKGGDVSALSLVYERHGTLLRREVSSCGVWASDRDDVVQEILLCLAKRLRGWHPSKCCAARGLKTIARAVAIDWVRRAQVEMERFSRLDELAEEPAARSARVDRSTEVAELLARLPETQRQAVQLVYLEEKTYIEAAEVMGITVKAVERRVQRAIFYLRW